MKHVLPAALRELIRDVAQEAGVEIYDIEHDGRNLRVFIEAAPEALRSEAAELEGGITVDACVRVSGLLSARLDQANLIPGRYILEVSSPGLERKLRGIDDFRRHVGQLIHVVTSQGGLDGTVRSAAQDLVVLAAADGSQREIALRLGDIKRANLKIPDQELFSRTGESKPARRKAGARTLSEGNNE
jgi:ribosome maturation factor RimP